MNPPNRIRTILASTILLVFWLPSPYSVQVIIPFLQADPVQQCANGVQLFLGGAGGEALLLLEAGFASRATANFLDPDDEGICTLALGILYERTGRYSDALEIYQIALKIFQATGNREFEGVTLNNIGLIKDSQGLFAEALKNYQAALAIHQDIDRVSEGITIGNIGAVYVKQGRYAEALAMFQVALAIHREVDNLAEEGNTLNNIGAVYDEQGRYEVALENYKMALAIHRQTGDRIKEGITLNNIGVIHMKERRDEEALKSYTAALDIHREFRNRRAEADTLGNMGLVNTRQGRYEEALENYQAALRISRALNDRVGEGGNLTNIGLIYQALGRQDEALENFQTALNISRQVGYQIGEGIVLTNIGQVYETQKRYQEAIEVYQQAMDVFESIRATAGSEEGRAAFIAQQADLYESAITLMLHQNQSDQAFFTGERGRARAFLDSLATGYVELSDTEAARGQLADLVPGRGLKNILGVAEVQALLDPNSTLLSYYTLEDQTLIFVITSDNFEVATSDISRETLNHQTGFLRNGLINADREEPFQSGDAQKLYETLITPVVHLLQTPRLIIVPHGPLHYLPFAALVDPTTGQFLIEQHSLVTLPSTSALKFIAEHAEVQQNATVNGAALVLGNPKTADYDATASLAFDRGSLGPLPFAEEEAAAVARLYGVEPLLGKEATEVVVQEQVNGSRILHIAAHGVYNPEAPLNSLVALAPGGEQDGWLTVSEVYGLELSQTDLVVLSACQTNLGDLSAGDEVVGLTRAFFFAGTPTVVATLWNVNDESTRILMEKFYTHLKLGEGKADALRLAQLELIQEGIYAHPYHWSAVVMAGDGGEVSQRLLTPGSTLTGNVQTPSTTVSQESSDQPSGSSAFLSYWIWLIIGMGVLAVIIAVGAVIWWRYAAYKSS